MVITIIKKFFEEVKKLKAFGIDTKIKDRKKQGTYQVSKLGFNYRMTDFQAALGYFQIKNYRTSSSPSHFNLYLNI